MASLSEVNEILRKHDLDNTEFPWIGDITEEVAIRFHERLMRQFEENPYRPIIIHINSYGGEVDALFSMLDTMDSIRSMAPPEFKFITVATGKAQSAGAALLSYGDFRFATPNARIMIHQVMGGVEGQQKDVEIQAREMLRIKNQINEIMAKHTGQSLKKIEQDTDRDNFMIPEDAKKYGLIDKIIQ